MPVQDDERERELARVFNLHWDPDHQRGGGDAELVININGQSYQFEVEVKSTTGFSVSTARDVGMEHIRKWRSKLFVIGFYSKARRPELLRCLCLTPADMEPWIAKIEDKIGIDFGLAKRASGKLGLDDLFEICGKHKTYTLKDAKRLHKQQWSVEKYKAERDVQVGGEKKYSQTKMLEILQLRAKYIAERGATLNNPHITKTHLAKFTGTERELHGPNWAADIRKIAEDFVRSNPGHPATIALPVSAGV